MQDPRLKRIAAKNLKAVNEAATVRARTPEAKASRNVAAMCRTAKQRCTNPNNSRWAWYGGRGIEFRFSSPAAMRDYVLSTLGPRPKGMVIDRIDNEGHYEVGNLRWATTQQSVDNRRDYKGWPRRMIS